MVQVIGPNDPITDPVVSRGRRLIKAILFIAVGYLLYYLVIDKILLRPSLGDKNMSLLNWVFFLVWTLMSFITILSIYWPDLKIIKREVREAESMPEEAKNEAKVENKENVEKKKPAVRRKAKKPVKRKKKSF
jgi:hypothetical protein